MPLSPVALFVYNRLEHLVQTIESLKKNSLAKDSELIVFSDAPKDEKSEAKVKEVRDYLETISGFKKVLIRNRKNNLSPKKNIIEGVSEVLNDYGKVIVLEDDLCVSAYFLNFMNDALLFYADEPKVISICGYMYPVKTRNCETLFLRLPDSWGWATWKRGWDLFEPDAKKLLQGLAAKKQLSRLDLDGAYGYSKLLRKQSVNLVSSWAILWHSSALLHEKLSLYPHRSLVQNIGFDDSGTHCGSGSGYDVNTLAVKVNVSKIPLEEDRDTINKIKMFHRINFLKRPLYLIRKACLNK